MPRKAASRVLYQKNPLIDVSCEFRFPTILRIGSQSPAGFQDQVRKDFPAFGIAPGSRAYNFTSDDQRWQIWLDKDVLRVVARTYDRWESFRSKIEAPFHALCAEYAPPFFTRVGLRYRNLVRRSALGVSDEDWGALLNPQLVGQTTWPGLKGEIRGSRAEVLMRLSTGQDHLRILHGLVTPDDPGNGQAGEVAYLIDHELFADGKTGIEDSLQKIEAFHHEAGQLFRGCVTDRLREVMVPQAA